MTKSFHTNRRGGRRNPIQFNLLVAGHSNTGKSTFLRTLFNTITLSKIHFPEGHEQTDSENIFPKNDIKVPTTVTGRLEFLPEAASEKVLLKMIDSPGISIPVNIHKRKEEDFSMLANDWLKSVLKFVESQYEATLLEESKSPDYQIHACFYFFNPHIIKSNGGITTIDIFILEKLTGTMNVIPCIGNSDQLSKLELEQVKSLIMTDLKTHEIQIQDFVEEPSSPGDDDADSTISEDDDDVDEPIVRSLGSEFQSLLPFALINGEEGGLTRSYPWGEIDVLNGLHCDYSKLREMVFSVFLHELKDITREVFYERWRTEKLMEVRGSVLMSGMAPGSLRGSVLA